MLWCDCRDFLYFQVLMGMLLATNYEKKPFLPKVEVAVKNLFNEPADAFYTGKVMDLLFDGVSIDCSSKEDNCCCLSSIRRRTSRAPNRRKSLSIFYTRRRKFFYLFCIWITSLTFGLHFRRNFSPLFIM